MEVKKKTFLENLRLKTKLPHLKKPGKKPLSKQGRQLANRRSISVPDLRSVPGETTRSALLSTASDNISVGISPRMSDTDSVASGSVTDGPIFRMDRLNDSFPEVTPRVHTVYAAAALNRISAPAAMNRLSAPDAMKRVSAPADILALYEETECMMNLERTGNLPEEALYARVNKESKGSGQIFTLDPVPAPRSVFNNTPNIYLPRPDRIERGSVSGEDTSGERLLPGSLAAALARAHSLGEQSTPYTDRRVKPIEQRKALSENRTSPVSKRIALPQSMFLTLDTLGAPLESVYGTSPDSASGTPSEERVSGPWATDSEELDLCFPTLRRRVSTEEALLEETRDEEAQREETRDDEALQEIGEMSSETFEFFEENVQDPTDNSQATGSEVQAHLSFQRYLLSINLKQGRNLVIKHKRSGTSDPYVKFRIEGKQFYKSKVVYKNLNPRWNESFSHALRDREHLVEVRVYDKNRTADEFMGSSSISLKNLELYKTYEMELHLEDPKSKGDELGVVFIDFCLMFRDATIKRSPRWPPRKNKQNQAAASQRLAEPQRTQPKNQMWSGMLSITLVEGQDLPQYGHGDVYVRFRLGDQKYKSKNLCIQANPQWREQFDFNQFDDNQEPLQVEVYWKSGRKGEESWGMFEVDLSRLSFNERHLNTHVLNPGKGRLVFLVTLRPCWGVSISDIEMAALEKSDERHTIVERFSLKNSHKCVGEVGFLQVKVIKANDLHPTDLNGKSNPLCVIELGNSKLQTHTIYKTVNPEWNKALTFPIKDIHDVMELTVLDDNGDKTPSFLGKVAIPLLSVQNGQQICPFLKKDDLGRASKGTITLVLDVIYNKVRAGVRTFKPEETKLMEENLKFSKKVLARNIYRVRKISTAVLYTLQYIKSCFQWESTQRSLIAFLIFLVTVWHWELFMLPLFLLLLIGWNYFQLSAGKASSNQDLVNMSMGDDEEEEEKESGKKGLMDKIHMVQEVVLVVQTVLDEIANIGERFKNIFNWSVPFMSCMTCLVLSVSTALLYFVPLRYIVLIWGVNKFTKKLRNPYTIDNNEILDFLKRVPSDVQKVQYSVLRAPTSQSQPRRKR